VRNRCKEILVTSLLFISFTYLSTNSYSNDKPVNAGDSIFYLSGGNIYRLIITNNSKADVIFTTPRENEKEMFEISGFSCGPDNTLVLNWFMLTKKS